jgi:Pyridoxamine 5'-phosphate oxidase
MTTATKAREFKIKTKNTGSARRATPIKQVLSRLTSEQVWHELEKGSFAVLSYVTPAGEPRSSGVMYKAIDHRLFVVVAPESWKARHIAIDEKVAVTVPVRRGGLLSLLFPIPPATISLHARAVVHRGDSPQARSIVERLANLLPADRRTSSSVLEIVPEGWFVAYGVGASLNDMRVPDRARARVPVHAILPESA